MEARAEGSISERLTSVLEQIHQAVQACGRREGTVRLVAATKTVPVERIREAVSAGLEIAGENRLQEALPKIEALRDVPVRWHFIGQLQRRKARSVVGVFDLIHSVDSLELAREIDRRAEAAGVRQDILLEINIAGEATKAGFGAEALHQQLPQFGALGHVRVTGLMAIPPAVQDAEQARPYFRAVRELAGRLSKQGIPNVSMDELSMGMSNDFRVAIEEGATLVRVGTAIFGARHG